MSKRVKKDQLDKLMSAPYALTKPERIKMRKLMDKEKQQEKDSRTLLPEVNYKD